MKRRTYAEFTADFPDEAIEENGEIIRYGGGSAMAAIRQLLSQLGYEVEDAEYAHIYGWRLNVWKAGRRFWLQLSDIGDFYILLTESRPGFWTRLLSKDLGAYREFLVQLNVALRDDPRFGPVVWNELIGGGFGDPTDDPLQTI